MRRLSLGLLRSLTPDDPTRSAREELSRRQALAGLAATMAAGCASGAGSETGGDTAAGPGTIDHIIVVMMENRSFDHFLGAMKLVEGREIDGLDASMSNTGSDGTVYAPFHAETQCVYDPPHGWNASHSQFNDGANDGFVTEYEADRAPAPAEVMSYMTREDLPVTWALADHYAVCDRWFCSVMGPTWPNRFYGHAGTSDGQKDNSWPEDGSFDFPTVWTKLEEIGVPWKYYYTDLPFIGLFEGHMRADTSAFLEDFVEDCARGRLPPVCWVDPGFSYNDDHPPHYVGLGQEFLSVVYHALATSPLWERCLLLITYDEHGGFFDHVPPPTTEDDHVDLGFDQMGFRIPVVVVGPWVKPGVCNTTFDNTSWLKLVCERFGIEPWTARIAAATSLAEVLDAERMAAGQPYAPAEVPVVDVDDEAVPDECLGGGLGPTAPPASGSRRRGTPVHVQNQEELQAFIRAHMPEHDHTDTVPARMARLRGWLRERQRGARGATGG